MKLFRRPSGKSPCQPASVVGPGGLELRALHAVYRTEARTQPLRQINA
jgi:hypothetical protein